MQIIKLKFRKISERGFFVTLSCSDRPWEIEGYLSPMPPALKMAVRQWQNNYRLLDGIRSKISDRGTLRVIPKSVRVSSSAESINAIEINLNLWLNNTASQWQAIRDGLIAVANQFQSQELQIAIDTQQIDLCRLPWQEWDLFRQYYPQAEVAISTPTAKDLAIAIPSDIINSKKARILLVVGKSDGINTQSDLEVIDRLLKKEAEIVCLLQPSLKELASALWCETGYHIFIFTGHSGSNDDGTIGWIEVNDTQCLTIEEFKESFKQAIDRGLQLAIFNSCDGLGLADRLSELNLAQIIVMSEPVPDEIAIEFLEHFFREFINGNSLFSSVHKARKQLEHFNTRYPGAVWLPTLCLKPASNYFNWSQINPRFNSARKLTYANKNILQNQSNSLSKLITIFWIIIISFITFILGLAYPVVFPQSELDLIIKPVTTAVKTYLHPEAEFNLPLGTWQYSGSTTWHEISNIINHKLEEKYPHFKLIYTYHPTLPNGSGTGIKMLLNGQISFAVSSRPVEDREYDAAIIKSKILKQVPVAIDGLAVVVNPNLNIQGLTIKQLEAIYRGKITNWGEIGGQDLPIVPYARPLQSGTTEFFRNNILNEHSYGKNVVFLEDTERAIERIEDINNPGGIYFVSLSKAIANCHLKILPIARRSGSIYIGLNRDRHACKSRPNNNLSVNNILLNNEVLQTGEYPLVRRLFIIIEINSPIDEEVGEAYKNFLLSKQGQELIGKAGFIPIRYF